MSAAAEMAGTGETSLTPPPPPPPPHISDHVIFSMPLCLVLAAPLMIACGLCNMLGDSRRNAILLCDGAGCQVALHQHCSGVAEIPEGDWLCDGCAAGIAPEAHACLLCPVSGGALRRVGGTGPVKLPSGGGPLLSPRCAWC